MKSPLETRLREIVEERASEYSFAKKGNAHEVRYCGYKNGALLLLPSVVKMIEALESAQKSVILSAQMAREGQKIFYPTYEPCDCEGGCSCKVPGGYMHLHHLEYHNLGTDCGLEETLAKIKKELGL